MFNVQILTSVSDCDTILAEAGKMKTSLEIKIETVTRQMNGYNAEAASLPEELSALQTDLASFTATLQTDLAPIARKELQKLKNKTEVRIRAILDEIASAGPVGYLTKSKNLDYYQGELELVNTLITEVTTRKTEIETSSANAA